MAQTVAIGVDTHKHAHVAVALDALGVELDHCTIETTLAGYKRLLRWAQRLGEPAFAVEGCGSYGAGLQRFLEASGVLVYECERPRRADRRRGKNDLIDARLAARRALSGEGLSTPRGGGQRRELLRLLLAERRAAVQARTAAINHLHAVVVTAPDPLRQRLAAVPKRRLAKTTAALRPHNDALGEVLRRVGRRAETLSREIAEIDHTLARLVTDSAPQLLAECGVGAVCAAQVLVSSGDPTRMKSEASFAALAGTSPVDASSGKQQRHRLNRGGDRQLNCALHVITLQRVRRHPETIAYYQRLLAAGKTSREARRCVKRALARRLYHQLRQTPLTT
jgi:transposase